MSRDDDDEFLLLIFHFQICRVLSERKEFRVDIFLFFFLVGPDNVTIYHKAVER